MHEAEFQGRLEYLPLRAIAAFAARAGMRVLPLADDQPEPDRSIIAEAIGTAADFARGMASGDQRLGRLVENIARSARNDDDRAYAAMGASTAALVVRMDPKYPAEPAKHVAVTATMLADHARLGTAAAAFWDAYSHDLSVLGGMRLGEPGTLGEVVDPSESGPLGSLWPNGAPSWYTTPTRPAGESQLSATFGGTVEAVADPPAPPLTLFFDIAEFSDGDIAEVLARLSDLYRSLGGDALVIDRMEMLDPASVLTPEEA